MNDIYGYEFDKLIEDELNKYRESYMRVNVKTKTYKLPNCKIQHFSMLDADFFQLTLKAKRYNNVIRISGDKISYYKRLVHGSDSIIDCDEIKYGNQNI